jgi:hypothetical protein
MHMGTEASVLLFRHIIIRVFIGIRASLLPFGHVAYMHTTSIRFPGLLFVYIIIGIGHVVKFI